MSKKQELTIDDYMNGLKANLDQTRDEANTIIDRFTKLQRNLEPTMKDAKNIDMSDFYNKLGMIAMTGNELLMYLDFAEKRLANIIEAVEKTKAGASAI